MLQKIVFATVATIIWYTIFEFLYLIGTIGHLDTDGNAPLWYTLLLLVLVIPLWALTVLRIFGYKWPKRPR